MIVTIDGPAGAGKSSAARGLAERLGFEFLDTGAMYRAVALAAMRAGLDWSQPQQMAKLARRLTIDIRPHQVLLGGQDVSSEIRTSAVTAVTRYAADNPQVRENLVQRQRQLASGGNYVTEGRDQGTVVFPDAECKIFLTATAAERARRRHADLLSKGEQISLGEVLDAQQARDRQDQNREVGALIAAPGAVTVTTDRMTARQVVDHLEQLVRLRQQPSQEHDPLD